MTEKQLTGAYKELGRNVTTEVAASLRSEGGAQVLSLISTGDVRRGNMLISSLRAAIGRSMPPEDAVRFELVQHPQPARHTLEFRFSNSTDAQQVLKKLAECSQALKLERFHIALQAKINAARMAGMGSDVVGAVLDRITKDFESGPYYPTKGVFNEARTAELYASAHRKINDIFGKDDKEKPATEIREVIAAVKTMLGVGTAGQGWNQRVRKDRVIQDVATQDRGI